MVTFIFIYSHFSGSLSALLLLRCCNCLHANGRQTIVLNEVRPRGSETDFIKG